MLVDHLPVWICLPGCGDGEDAYGIHTQCDGHTHDEPAIAYPVPDGNSALIAHPDEALIVQRRAVNRRARLAARKGITPL